MLWLNALGAALLGYVQHSPRYANPQSQAFWATGFCGGFTTLSGIAMFSVLGHQDAAFVIGYVLVTITLGLVGYAGFARFGRRAGAQ